MCKELQLVIEVDGITHTWEETIVKDKIKEEKLREAGFHVLRFDDEDVLKNINRVDWGNWFEDWRDWAKCFRTTIEEKAEEEETPPLPPPAGDNTPENTSQFEIAITCLLS